MLRSSAATFSSASPYVIAGLLPNTLHINVLISCNLASVCPYVRCPVVGGEDGKTNTLENSFSLEKCPVLLQQAAEAPACLEGNVMLASGGK